jgi:hypothetical protein
MGRCGNQGCAAQVEGLAEQTLNPVQHKVGSAPKVTAVPVMLLRVSLNLISGCVGHHAVYVLMDLFNYAICSQMRPDN